MISEKALYRNHLGEELDLSAQHIWLEPSDLHDYAWTAQLRNRRICGFTRESLTRRLPVVIACRTEEEGLAARNRLFEVAEKDVLAQKPGRLIVGGYYLSCYITGSKKRDYLFTGRHLRAELTITAPDARWIRETVLRFRGEQTGTDASAFEYAFDYAIDYLSGLTGSRIQNDAFTASPFRMVIYGPCSTPTVYINGHEYKVNCTLAGDEFLTVSSAEKTVLLTRADGKQINCFSLRGRDSYLFEPVPAGSCIVTWQGDLLFDLILLEERSEPKWI